jgi:hypothetical protein
MYWQEWNLLWLKEGRMSILMTHHNGMNFTKIKSIVMFDENIYWHTTHNKVRIINLDGFFSFFFSITALQVWYLLPSWQIPILLCPKFFFSNFLHPHSSGPIQHHPSTFVLVFLLLSLPLIIPPGTFLPALYHPLLQHTHLFQSAYFNYRICNQFPD